MTEIEKNVDNAINEEEAKYLSADAVTMRDTLRAYEKRIDKLNYSLFCANKIYKKVLADYRKQLGFDEGSQK